MINTDNINFAAYLMYKGYEYDSYSHNTNNDRLYSINSDAYLDNNIDGYIDDFNNTSAEDYSDDRTLIDGYVL